MVTQACVIERILRNTHLHTYNFKTQTSISRYIVTCYAFNSVFYSFVLKITNLRFKSIVIHYIAFMTGSRYTLFEMLKETESWCYCVLPCSSALCKPTSATNYLRMVPNFNLSVCPRKKRIQEKAVDFTFFNVWSMHFTVLLCIPSIWIESLR